MERVGIYEAKAKLSDLVDQVGRGRQVTITKHGKAVAKLVPVRGAAEIDRSAAVDDLIQFSKTIKLKRKLTQHELREMQEWGRD